MKRRDVLTPFNKGYFKGLAYGYSKGFDMALDLMRRNYPNPDEQGAKSIYTRDIYRELAALFREAKENATPVTNYTQETERQREYFNKALMDAEIPYTLEQIEEMARVNNAKTFVFDFDEAINQITGGNI